MVIMDYWFIAKEQQWDDDRGEADGVYLDDHSYK
jgi:hypothetical protein